MSKKQTEKKNFKTKHLHQIQAKSKPKKQKKRFTFKKCTYVYEIKNQNKKKPNKNTISKCQDKQTTTISCKFISKNALLFLNIHFLLPTTYKKLQKKKEITTNKRKNFTPNNKHFKRFLGKKKKAKETRHKKNKRTNKKKNIAIVYVTRGNPKDQKKKCYRFQRFFEQISKQTNKQYCGLKTKNRKQTQQHKHKIDHKHN